ncbi:MAG: hypothetical protein KME05_21575 [Gloeocapsa sp. UFS-A4-WI-NPMV-4B04]|nr:hypothetical protein [Gloeocapsa sp. UFS-A4-WI-NPMV-4B04]
MLVVAKGHGRRQRCGTDKFGFPTGHAPSSKFFMNFQTGDMVKANIPNGKYAGTLSRTYYYPVSILLG